MFDQYSKLQLLIFGWDLTNYTPFSQLVICVSGTFIFYVSSNFFLEKLFVMEGFQYGWYFTTVQFIVYTTISGATLWNSGLPKRRAPLSSYVAVAGIQVASMGLANTALIYLSYPIQQLFKSCKLLPVMIGGKIIMKRVYSWGEIISAALLTLGLAVLTAEKFFGDRGQLTYSLVGIIMISSALIADGAIGNLQERVMHGYQVTEDELVFYSHLFGSLMLIVIALITGELISALYFTYEQPLACAWMFGTIINAYVGLRFVLGLIKVYGSFVAMTITSCRKVVSIALSFILFPKILTLYYLGAAILVFGGISLQIYTKNHETVDRCLLKREYFKEFDHNGDIEEGRIVRV